MLDHNNLRDDIMTHSLEIAHTPTCFAAALICAVENIRDYAIDQMNYRFDPITPAAAAAQVRSADYTAIAQGYLADEVTNCCCN